VNIKSKLKQIGVLTYFYDSFKKIYYKHFISDKKLINKKFKKRLGRNVELRNPIYYNDKLQWLKLYWHDPVATTCADKYEVREFVKEKIGGKYLNDLLGVYENVYDINLNKLPSSFVLKGTHGSGYNIICENKNQMNWNKEFVKMRRWLRNNYYWPNREWVYKDIQPRIVCEKYLSDETGNPPMDYKIFCFHGEPKLIQVDIDRFGSHKSNLYNIEWILQDVEIENLSDKNILIEKPATLNEMLDLSRKLSEDFPHVRVDFYNINDKVIFGELTFFHHGGFGKFNPPEFELQFGNYIKQP